MNLKKPRTTHGEVHDAAQKASDLAFHAPCLVVNKPRPSEQGSPLVETCVARESNRTKHSWAKMRTSAMCAACAAYWHLATAERLASEAVFACRRTDDDDGVVTPHRIK